MYPLLISLKSLKTLPTDADVEAWLKTHCAKHEEAIKAFNETMTHLGPETKEHKAMMAKIRNKIAPDRTDINTWFALMELDDEKTFAL